MLTPQDCSITIGREDAYATAVTPDRSLEFTSESLDLRKAIKQGAGLRPGSKVARSARRYVPTRDAGGDTQHEVLTRGYGMLYEAMLGKGTSTLTTTAGLYQQVFTMDTLPSHTIQKALPALASAGGFELDVYTLLGALVTDWELTVANADIFGLKLSWDGRDIVQTPAAEMAPLAYPVDAHQLTFAGACLYTGTLTPPTATELASATQRLANVVSASIQSASGYKTDRYVACGQGGKSKPVPNGLRSLSGSIEVEHTAGSLWVEAIMDEAPLALIVEYHAIEDPTETLQIVIPEIKVDGELPKGTGEMISTTMSWVGLDNQIAAEPIWIVSRTHDTAL